MTVLAIVPLLTVLLRSSTGSSVRGSWASSGR